MIMAIRLFTNIVAELVRIDWPRHSKSEYWDYECWDKYSNDDQQTAIGMFYDAMLIINGSKNIEAEKVVLAKIKKHGIEKVLEIPKELLSIDSDDITASESFLDNWEKQNEAQQKSFRKKYLATLQSIRV